MPLRFLRATTLIFAMLFFRLRCCCHDGHATTLRHAGSLPPCHCCRDDDADMPACHFSRHDVADIDYAITPLLLRLLLIRCRHAAFFASFFQLITLFAIILLHYYAVIVDNKFRFFRPDAADIFADGC